MSSRFLKRSLVSEIYGNEIFVDSSLRRRLGIAKGGINYRPLRYRRFNGSRICFIVSIFIWPVVLFFVNLAFFINSILKPSYNISNLRGRTIWLESSAKSERLRLIAAPKLKEVSDNITIIDIRRKDYLCYLSKYERALALIEALVFISFRSSEFELRNKMQLLDLYRVLCFVVFLRKASLNASGLHICNHYDRWAMACYMFFFKGVEVWQHGVLDPDLKLPIKLRNIICIHSLGLEEHKVWLSYVEDFDVKITPQPFFFKTDKDQKVNILVVSHPGYIEEEINLLDVIVEAMGRDAVAYKPHPVYSYSSVMHHLINMQIKTLLKDEFPSADIVITKGSTLGREYESIGIEVFWWNEESVFYILDFLKSFPFRVNLSELSCVCSQEKDC